MVIVSLTYVLPQLQHHAPGVLEVRSLALLAPSSRDPVFRQLAASSGTSSTSGWVAPITTLPVSPPPLEKGHEEGTIASVPKPKGKRRYKC